MKITSKHINYTVDTVDDLLSLAGEENATVVVTEEGRGGLFIYRGANSAINDEGTIFNGWTRDYSGAVNPLMFGAKAKWGYDDTVPFQNMLNTSKNIDLLGKYYVIDDVVFLQEGTFINGNGASIVSSISRFISGRETPIFGILGLSNIRIEGIKFEFANPTSGFSAPAIRLILANSPADNLLYDIDGNVHESTNISCGNIYIRNCSFINCGNHQIVMNGGIIRNVVIENNQSYGCIRGYGIGYSATSYVYGLVVKNNLFIFSDVEGVTLKRPIAIKLDGFVDGAVIDSNTIRNQQNSFVSDAYPIHLECGVENTEIVNNEIIGDYIVQGIHLAVGQVNQYNTKQAPEINCVISGNTIYGAEYGILAYMPIGITISNNTIFSNKRGIQLNYIDTSVAPFTPLDSNAAWFMSTYGETPYPKDNIIKSNSITLRNTTDGLVGIKVTNGINTIIDSNIVKSYNTTSSGIYPLLILLDGCTDTFVSKNKLTGGNGSILNLASNNSIIANNIMSKSFHDNSFKYTNISLFDSDKCSVKGNTATSDIASMYIENCTKSLVGTNLLYSGGATTIDIQGTSDYILLNGNVLYGDIVVGSTPTNITDINNVTTG